MIDLDKLDMNKEHKLINTYRTPFYIVKQDLYLSYLPDGMTTVFSLDSYTPRTKKLDKIFDKKFKFRAKVDGRRIRVGLYKRKYL